METIITKQKPVENHGEDLSLADIILQGRKLGFQRRIENFNNIVDGMDGNYRPLYFRSVLSAADREVLVDDGNNKLVKMLMFGSNNYLGLANHPYVKFRVKQAIDKYGVGIGGPPLLNGYSILMKELEERLSYLKGGESALIFTSGYNANVGLVSGLCSSSDIIIADELSHASFFDGMKLFKGKRYTFKHNDTVHLEKLLAEISGKGDVFVGVEGIYSMEGDLAPLDVISSLCKKYKATLLLDDAHATGVIGDKGGGTHDYYHLSSDKDIILGTFSKAFAVNGGFITASKPIVRYLRFMARSYMFSASLPPVTVAAVLAGLDVLEKEPRLRCKLKSNVRYAAQKLRAYGMLNEPEAAIISLKAPVGKHIRQLANEFHDAGIFINSIEYPAVPKNQERFRISIMATHTKADIDRLVATVEEIWYNAEKK